jgi:hypothetical protein
MTGEVSERSIAGQVEFWARLGRAVEKVMRTDQLVALKRAGDAQLVSQSLAAVETPKGRQQLSKVLQQRPYPHFETAAGRPGFVIRIDASGTRTLGRFVQRVFTPAEPG